MSNMPNNYEKTYLFLEHWLANLDAQSIYQRLGLDAPIDNELHLKLLRRHYRINKTGVFDEGGEGRENVNCKSVLIYYLTHGGKGEPLYRFKPLSAFSQGIFTGGEQKGTLKATRLGELYTAKSEHFAQAMELLEASPVQATSGADAAWRFNALPKMPLELRYYHEDEEFPCTINLFVDETALTYLPFETLAVFTGCVLDELEHIAECLS